MTIARPKRRADGSLAKYLLWYRLLYQGFPTHSPRGNFVWPLKLYDFVGIAEWWTNDSRMHFIMIFWVDSVHCSCYYNGLLYLKFFRNVLAPMNFASRGPPLDVTFSVRPTTDLSWKALFYTVIGNEKMFTNIINYIFVQCIKKMVGTIKKWLIP